MSEFKTLCGWALIWAAIGASLLLIALSTRGCVETNIRETVKVNITGPRAEVERIMRGYATKP